jgi:hypothetical protein
MMLCFKNRYVIENICTQILKQHISMELIIPSIINICKTTTTTTTTNNNNNYNNNLLQVRPGRPVVASYKSLPSIPGHLHPFGLQFSNIFGILFLFILVT